MNCYVKSSKNNGNEEQMSKSLSCSVIAQSWNSSMQLRIAHNKKVQSL